MTHTPLHGWKERDRKAEEKRKKAKGQPIQKPPKPPRKKKKRGSGRTGRTGVTSESRQNLTNMASGVLEGAQSVAPFLTPGAGMARGAEAIVKRRDEEQDDMRWKTGKKSKTIDLKKGGKVHGAGLARRRRS